LIATQTQKVVEKEAQTDRKRAVIEAEKLYAVSKIDMEKSIAEKESQRNMSSIEDQVHLDREKAFADAQLYKAKKEVEGNTLILTGSYLQLSKTKSLATNAHIVFGDQIPKSLFVSDQKHNNNNNNIANAARFDNTMTRSTTHGQNE